MRSKLTLIGMFAAIGLILGTGPAAADVDTAAEGCASGGAANLALAN